MGPFKIWKFEDERTWQKLKIALFTNRVEISNDDNKSIKVFSLDQVLENNAPLADLKTDYELLKEIVKLVERDILSEKSNLLNMIISTKIKGKESICI